MNPISRLAVRSALAALALVAAPAGAEQRGAGMVYDRATFPYGERVNQPLTLPASLFRLDVPVVTNLTKDFVGEPVNVPLALDYGVTNDVQVGVFHDTGLCLTGTSKGCAKAYDDVGGRASIGLSRTPEAQLALQLSLLAFDFEDTRYDAGAGLAYKRSLGNVGVAVDAGLTTAVTKRSDRLFTALAIANAEGAVQLGESLSVFGRVGLNRALDTAAGVTARTNVPVTLGVELEPIRKFDVGVEVGFPNLLGQDGTADDRELTVLLRLFI